jgi:dihydroorotate dehydrogenase
MRWWYRRVVRPILFRQNPEVIHDWTLGGLGWVSRHGWARGGLRALCGVAELPIERFGLRFPNPVGLAAGMDKSAEAVPVWEAMGFGFSELGGVTWVGQPGNPRPRVFRVVSEEAIINRMGFNNPGVEVLVEKLEGWRRSGSWPAHPVGMNLGKSKATPLGEAAEEYARCFRVLRGFVDFFVVNVSSPNTPDLRRLQDKAALDEILAALQEENRAGGTGAARPVLVKVAPDLSWDALDEILGLVGPRGVAGLVATNTTVGRPASADVRVSRLYGEAGGLSGRPLRARSTEVIRHIHRASRGSVPVIGVGGVFTLADAWEKLTAGACLVQVYTGLVYEGPTMVRAIVEGLRERMRAEGMTRLEEVVGCGAG